MRLGLLGELTDEILGFAGANGLVPLELICDRGTQIDPEKMNGSDVENLKKRLSDHHVEIASFAWYITNTIELDKEQRKANLEYFKKIVALGKELRVPVISAGTLHHPSLTVKGHLEEALDIFEEVFSQFAEEASRAGMKLVVENCPEFGNLPYSPELIRLLFDRVPNKAFGLEYDPSHLIWQGIDPIRFIREFGERIYVVHGKDTRILEDNLYDYGVCGKMFGDAGEKDSYWRYCLPGHGNVDWEKVFYALYEVGFDGDVFIENEDRLFGNGPDFHDGPEALKKRCRGILLTKKYLEQFIA